MSRSSTVVVFVAASSLLAGCTTWGTTTRFSPVTEVSRKTRGMPSLVTSSSTSVDAGFAGAAVGPLLAGGFSAGTQSYTRTRCVQDVDVAYEQPYEIHPVEVGRGKDKWAGIALAVTGVLFVASGFEGKETYDPYYGWETTGTSPANFAVGGALLAGGIGLLVYSYTSLPREPRPEIQRGVNRWVTTQTVDAEGCAPPPPPPAVAGPGAPVVVQTSPTTVNVNTARAGSTSDRLRELDKLRASGAVSDAEYKKKRAEIVDGL